MPGHCSTSFGLLRFDWEDRFPPEVLPLVLVRPISGSGSLALLAKF